MEESDVTQEGEMGRGGWHLDKQIPISLLAVLVIQTAGGVWWAATLTGKIDNATAVLNRWEGERYTKSDADRDRQLMSFYVTALERRDAELERRLQEVEIRSQRHLVPIKP